MLERARPGASAISERATGNSGRARRGRRDRIAGEGCITRGENSITREKHHIPARAGKGFVLKTGRLFCIGALRDVRGRAVRPFNERMPSNDSPIS
jgi:hypothetical protein